MRWRVITMIRYHPNQGSTSANFQNTDIHLNEISTLAGYDQLYGDSPAQPQDEQTRVNPKSPYGVAKTYAHQIVGAYLQQYGLQYHGIMSIMKRLVNWTSAANPYVGRQLYLSMNV